MSQDPVPFSSRPAHEHASSRNPVCCTRQVESAHSAPGFRSSFLLQPSDSLAGRPVNAMPLIALGLNHLTAPVALRERVAIDADDTPPALIDLAAQPGVEEAMILSTCNRTELYCSVHEGAVHAPKSWLHARNQMTPGRLDEFLYRHTDGEAVRHVFRVATGLDSMVLGEPQILGQVKEAWRAARSAHTLHAPMDRLLQNAFAVAKRVRTQTRIGTGPVSVAFTAVRLVEQAFADLRESCVL